MSEKYKHNEQLEDVLRYMNDAMPEAERYKFERELERDPFMQEALDGLSEMKTSDIDRDIRNMDVISGKKRLSLGFLKYMGYAAGIALFIFAGFWAVQNIDFSKKQSAKSDTESDNLELREPYKPVQTDTIDSLSTVVDSSKMMLADAGLQQTSYAQLQTVNGTNNLQGQTTAKEKPAPAKDLAKKKSTSLEAAQQVALKTAEEDLEINSAADEVTINEEPAISTSDSKSRNESSEDLDEPENALKRPGVNAEPQPLGGNTLFKSYVENNTKYPDGIQNGKKEFVKIKFKITKTGNPTGFVIEKSPDNLFSQEAIRVIQNGPKWSPKIKDGIPVEGEVSIRVNFKPSGK